MSINISEEVQKKLLFPPLQKIDPNAPNEGMDNEAIHFPVTQAAIVTALAGLYKITRTTAGCTRLLLKGQTDSWLEDVYGDNLGKTISHVAEFSHWGRAEVEKLVRLSADACLIIVHEQLGSNIEPDVLKDFMSSQRDSILVYIPAQLQLGEMLHDTTIDDNTNKMEGPVSSLMHKIENIFSEDK